MSRTLLLIACCFGALAVIFGAFGAHALKSRLTPEMMAIYQTGVQYHFYHTMPMLLCGLLMYSGMGNNVIIVAGCSFMIGIIVFSGSLYALAITDTGWLGAVTPVGGIALIAGWVALAIGVMQNNAR